MQKESLKTDSFSDANAFLIAIRYLDSEYLLDSKESKNQSLISMVKTSLLGYGSTHSARSENPTGLFTDLYGREAIHHQGSATDLFSVMLVKIQKKLRAQLNLSEEDSCDHFFPVSDVVTMKKILGPSFSIYFTDNIYTIDIVGKQFSMIEARSKEPKDIKMAQQVIGMSAQFPNKESQLWVVAHADDDFKATFQDLFNKKNMLTMTLTKVRQSYQPSKAPTEQIREDLLKELKKHIDFRSQKTFYIEIFINIIQNINIKNENTDEINEHIKRSFCRLKYILEKAMLHKDEDIFGLYIEFAFDELMFINQLTQSFNISDMRDILIKFIRQVYLLSDRMPISVSLGNSGMDILEQLLITALSESKESSESINVFLKKEAYFEIPLLLLKKQMQSKVKLSDFPEEMCITFDNSKTATINRFDKNQNICDIIMCDFLSSVSPSNSEHKAFDVQKLIEDQLVLRKNKRLNKKLIVVIDTTNNRFDDDDMQLLLEYFKTQIQTGQLAILTGQSLNKHFHMGLDKLPAGLSAGFFNKKYYPQLEKFYKNNVLVNYTESDAIPQMIASLLKDQDIIDKNLQYKREIQQKTYTYSNKLPTELMEKKDNQLISVYKPSATFFQTWSFIVFKFDFKPSAKISSINIRSFSNMLHAFDIQMRSGYGYNELTYSEISTNIFRLNIGKDDYVQTRKKLNLLAKYAIAINEAYRKYGNDQSQYANAVNEIEKIYKNHYKKEIVKVEKIAENKNSLR